MKKLICAILALSLLGTAAASAQPYGNHGGNARFYQDRGHDYRGGYRGHNDGALIGLGIGLFALAAIAASQHDRNYGPAPDSYGYQGGYPGR